ncbi:MULTISPECIES: cytosine permease [unclassified Pseudomonas]|uniref:purine-cytosine permease family protein n=1 Tax=unclassified Pseudomonas TaxID=196821 RepID=UPI0002A363B2|nr:MULTISPECIES: cytosine permease [unclassified Pseudomonas]MBB1607172.1 allantoin permease [Pseudomonas sp. UMC76]MBB1639310.1 allantoin permease [Pseudomonas sp. UME83]NTX93268.1 cytosine permease [Pseudomonas sp. UMA643]NTY22715.1 cytosine permease [Pseudomonas sp. UMC3103]NTY28790.1 cytosine permease [Pseudomonas sp. UMA603]
MSHTESTPLIENHTVDYVPPAERHGRARDLFTLWFSTNIAPLPVVTGAMVVQVYHLDLLWGLVAIFLGHMLGGVGIALASAQGPQLGIPQMVQSRGQFGRYGALLIVFFTALIYLGFFISNIVLAGESIHSIAPAVPLPAGILLGALGATAIGVIGYRFIHTLNRIGTWVMGGALLVGFAWIFCQQLPADFFSRGGFNLSGFVATLCLGIIWQVSFSPYTSDYSRYLPASVGIARPFFATFFGAVLGTSLSFSFGAVAVLATPEGTEAMAAVKQATGVFGPALMVLFLLNIISHNALNLYGAVLSIVTSIQTFAAQWTPSVRLRVALSSLVLGGSCLVALSASANFISQFIGLILTLLLVLVPWACINLIDFYLVKRGRYDIASIFRADGGIYGRFNPHAITAYAIGILVQLPFANTALYVGPYANYLEGADLSWLAGLLVTCPLYYCLATRGRARESLRQGRLGLAD